MVVEATASDAAVVTGARATWRPEAAGQVGWMLRFGSHGRVCIMNMEEYLAVPFTSTAQGGGRSFRIGNL